MSSRGATLAGQVLKKAAECLGQDCALCGARSAAFVCSGCAEDLPWLRAACVRCAAPLSHEGICGGCLRRAHAFDAAAAAFVYGFPVDRLVRRFKFAADFATGRWLAEALADRVAAETRPDLLVATPLASARLRSRGFNQAVEVARVIGARLRVPVEPTRLAKVRDTEPQSGLGLRERSANLRGAFRCRPGLEGRHVAIVDDVVTTGATGDELARALKAAGAARVSVWCVARTP